MRGVSSETQLGFLAKTLRVYCLRTTTQAGSGHPTSCLSAADLVSVLFFHEMCFDLNCPANPHNDRFVLSKGHAAPLLYAAWSLAGALPFERLLTLRRVDSELEGHPTPRFPLAETATGSLGQGLSMGIGMALAARLNKSEARVYVLLGDGEVAEGAIWEAAAFASFHKLDNLVAILDVNGLGQSQRTMHGFDTAAYQKKFEAFGWTAFVIDGHDPNAIIQAFEGARRVANKPTVLVAKTIKGKGVSFLEDKELWHGKPLKKEELDLALTELKAQDLTVSESFPLKKPRLFEPLVSGSSFSIESPSHNLGAQVTTREAYGTALKKLGSVNKAVVALDGDTKNSTYAEMFAKNNPERYFEGFIAEQNMVGVAVGLARQGKIPFVSTFGAFLTRAYDFIRMAGIGRANIKLCGSHAGISIGEDGPSQMALEDLAMMRAIPNSVILYPSDAVSCEKLVLEAARYKGIAYIRTTRPKTPVIYKPNEEFPIGGCKLLRQSPKDKITVVAAGVTLFEALKAHEELLREDLAIRVIDSYCVKPLDKETITKAASQTNKSLVVIEDHYREGGLGAAVLEAVGSQGFRVYQLAIQDIPRSGKAEELLDFYGISSRCLVDFVRKLSGVSSQDFL